MRRTKRKLQVNCQHSIFDCSFKARLGTRSARARISTLKRFDTVNLYQKTREEFSIYMYLSLLPNFSLCNSVTAECCSELFYVGGLSAVPWSASEYIVDWRKCPEMQRMFCFLPFTRVWNSILLLHSTISHLNPRSVHPSLFACTVYHSGFWLDSQSKMQPPQPSISFFNSAMCCHPHPALTGAGLEVALSEDGGDGRGVIQAVVIIWTESWWIQSGAHCCLGFSPVTHNHHGYYQRHHELFKHTLFQLLYPQTLALPERCA